MKNFAIYGRLFAIVFLPLTAALTPSSAGAWFIFIPGALSRAVSDSLTGAKGDLCVNEKAQVGDVLRAPSGNTGLIKSLSGTSGMCQGPNKIRAEVEFSFLYSSKAQLDIPEEFQAKPITEFQRYNGRLIFAESKTKRNKGIVISGRKKEPTSDALGVANATEKLQIAALVEGKSSNAEQLVINGANAWRFEVAGKLQGMFGRHITYIFTVLDGDSEIVVVMVYIETSDFEEEKLSIRKLADGVSGIKIALKANVPDVAADQKGRLDPTAVEILGREGGVNTPIAKDFQANIVSKPLIDAPAAGEVSIRLKNLSQLFKEGLISEREFVDKKRELLDKM